MALTEPAAALGAAPAQFYIPASASLQERRPRTLKHGDTFGVFDHNGDVLSGPGSPEGLFHRDTRYLSHLEISLAGKRPLLLSSTPRDDNAALTCDLTNPDLFDGGGVAVEHDLIHLRRSKFLWRGVCFERIAVRNFCNQRQRLAMEIRFAADFADLFEVRGMTRAARGEIRPARLDRDRVTLSYRGLDEVERRTQIRFDPPPRGLRADRASFELDLSPWGHEIVFLEIACDGESPAGRPRTRFLSSFRDARRALRAASSRAASVATSNEVFNEAVRRSVSDLYMLVTDKSTGPYPYAGIPWFSAAFGRDAVITGLLTLWMDPAIARGVLHYLAAHQAVDLDPAADAEPGKILHEVRNGEMAELGEVPFRRYYGSIDSTPLFIMLAGAYLERTADRATLKELWPNIEAALAWIDEYGDRDCDGFVEYGRMTDEGLVNQGWKDSHDSIFHADGELARAPIALAEVQAYVYGARRAAAAIAAELGDARRAEALTDQAAALKRRFDEAFWSDEIGTYALALDRAKRPCLVRSSNAGHALFTGIAEKGRAQTIADGLMSSAFFSGWGIRTVASTEARYNPMSYHNGSVWPHDNALIAMGLARYGRREAAARLFHGLFDASVYIDLRRLPELFCGFARRRGQGPTFYPVACSPQAWAAATPLGLLQACLGMGFDRERRAVTFHQPILPEFLDQVTLRGIRLDEGRIDVLLRRIGREVAMHVIDRHGDIRAMLTA